MSWSMGWDSNWERWIGYGVRAYCDHPKCSETIDRGLAHVCCNQEPRGGEKGCGLYFCDGDHGDYRNRCSPCQHGRKPYTPKPEHPEWVAHLTNDPSWAEWRATDEGKRYLAEWTNDRGGAA